MMAMLPAATIFASAARTRLSPASKITLPAVDSANTPARIDRSSPLAAELPAVSVRSPADVTLVATVSGLVVLIVVVVPLLTEPPAIVNGPVLLMFTAPAELKNSRRATAVSRSSDAPMPVAACRLRSGTVRSACSATVPSMIAPAKVESESRV